MPGAPGALRTITSAGEAHGLSSKEAARAYPIHLKAVVTYYDPNIGGNHSTALFVNDATGSIYVALAYGTFISLPPGTLVDVQGVSDPGEFAPIVAQPKIKIIGFDGLPKEAGHPSLAQLSSGTEDGQWVELEGVVHSLFQDETHIGLQLTLSDGVISVLLAKEPGVDYSRLIDSRIRIRGNAGPLFDSTRTQMIGFRLQCPTLAAVQVEEPAPTDPFNLPTIPINRLLRWDEAPSLAHRVHVQGRVTLQWPGTSICIRDAQRGICAQTEQTTLVKNGDLIDLAGFARAEGSSPVLTDAIFRVVPTPVTETLTALPVTPDQALRGSNESQLIQIEGQLISRDLASSDTTLLLASGKSIFTAILPEGLSGPETKTWKIGSVLRITGICSVHIDERQSGFEMGTAVPKSFRVLLRSAADVQILETPSWWTPVHAILVLTLALTGTLCVLLWVIELRKRLKHQTHVLRDQTNVLREQTKLLRESEERFRHMAMHDALTGLATRVLLQDRLEMTMEAARRHHRGMAVLMLDIDKFKEVNDTLGHQAGDEVLRITANRVLGAVRASDTVARLGGDEFVALLPDLTDLRVSEVIAARIVTALSVPMPLSEGEISVTVSIGICTSPDGELEAEELLKNADAALYRAKSRGRNCYEIYNSELDQK